VRYRWCDEEMVLPLSHDLPRFCEAFPLYNLNLGHLTAKLASCLGRKIVAVDIGANVGDTAILMVRNGARRVICIEGSPRYSRLLIANTRHLPEVTSLECLVAFADAPSRLTISEENGSGFAITANSEPAVRTSTLDQLLGASGVNAEDLDLLKIDTDGYDGAIIRHHVALLRTVQPVIFFEYMFSPLGRRGLAVNLPDDQVWAALAHAGYDKYIVYRNTGEAVAVASVHDAGSVLNGLFATNQLGSYADVAVFPMTKRAIAVAVAKELGL